MASSLPTLRRALAGSLDDIGVYAVTSATTNTIACTALADATTNASVHRYDGRWVYIATGSSAGTQRRVIPGGFAPAYPRGGWRGGSGSCSLRLWRWWLPATTGSGTTISRT